MHSIIDIAKQSYPDLITCRLDDIVNEEVLQDHITKWKRLNRPVLLESDDNPEHRRRISIVEKQYEKFAFTSPGRNKDDRQIANVDFLTRFTCDPTQFRIDHSHKKKYKLLFLVGKTQPYRWDLLLALAKHDLLKGNLISLQNKQKAFSHVLPERLTLPDQYEWQEIVDLGGFQSDALPYSKLNIAHLKNFGKIHPKLYRDTAISIVSEGSIDPGINLVTEKTWIPIVAEHLMVFQSTTGHKQFLNELGFNLNFKFIPDYDELDHEMIADICLDLNGQSSKSLYKKTVKQRQHNRNLALDEKHWQYYHLQQLKNFNWDNI